MIGIKGCDNQNNVMTTSIQSQRQNHKLSIKDSINRDNALDIDERRQCHDTIRMSRHIILWVCMKVHKQNYNAKVSDNDIYLKKITMPATLLMYMLMLLRRTSFDIILIFNLF